MNILPPSQAFLKFLQLIHCQIRGSKGFTWLHHHSIEGRPMGFMNHNYSRASFSGLSYMLGPRPAPTATLEKSNWSPIAISSVLLDLEFRPRAPLEHSVSLWQVQAEARSHFKELLSISLARFSTILLNYHVSSPKQQEGPDEHRCSQHV